MNNMHNLNFTHREQQCNTTTQSQQDFPSFTERRLRFSDTIQVIMSLKCRLYLIYAFDLDKKGEINIVKPKVKQHPNVLSV